MKYNYSELKKHEETEDILRNQMQDFKLFYILSHEKEQIFRFQNSLKTKSNGSILQKEEINMYQNMHPMYSVTNDMLKKIFKTTRVRNLKDISVFDLLYDTYLSFFLLLKPKGFSQSKSAWLLYTKNGATVYYVEEDYSETIPDLSLISISGKSLIIQGDDEKKVFNIKKFSSARELIGKMKDSSQISYYMYGLSIQAFKSTPPLKLKTRSFLRSIAEDPKYLFFLSQLPYSREDSESQLFPFAWVQACGFSIRSLLPLIIYLNFKELSSFSLVLRSNSFLTYLLTTIIKKDSGFESFMEAMSNVANDPSPCNYFVSEFAKTKFSPLCRFLFYCVYSEAKRIFPGKDAQYFAISGLLFLRLMTPKLYEKNIDKATISEIHHVFNFEKAETPISLRLKQLIDEFSKFPDDCDITLASSLSEEYIELLIKKPVSKIDSFIELAWQKTFSSSWNYYKSVIGNEIQG